MKLSWHPASSRWCKVIGKRLNAAGDRLVQAQFYFSADRDRSAADAAALKKQWSDLKRTWAVEHEPYLITLGDSFAAIPHWYQQSSRGTSVTNTDAQAVRDDLDRGTDADAAFEHADMTLSELQALYVAHRSEAENIDFKATTNKTFTENLAAAMRHIDGQLVARELTPAHVKRMRLDMLKDGTLRKRTVRNWGMAFKSMLTWYCSRPTSRRSKRRRSPYTPGR